MRKLLPLLLLLMNAQLNYAQISGKVFRDLNGDGIQQTPAEPDIVGALIDA